MCNCHSYNAGTGEAPEVQMDPNPYFRWDNVAKTVCVDACIAHVVRHLWENEIQTVGSCCGHNKRGPNIILREGCRKSEADRAIALIAEVDDREFDILSWQLVSMNPAIETFFGMGGAGSVSRELIDA